MCLCWPSPSLAPPLGGSLPWTQIQTAQLQWTNLDQTVYGGREQVGPERFETNKPDISLAANEISHLLSTIYE